MTRQRYRIPVSVQGRALVDRFAGLFGGASSLVEVALQYSLNNGNHQTSPFKPEGERLTVRLFGAYTEGPPVLGARLDAALTRFASTFTPVPAMPLRRPTTFAFTFPHNSLLLQRVRAFQGSSVPNADLERRVNLAIQRASLRLASFAPRTETVEVRVDTLNFHALRTYCKRAGRDFETVVVEEMERSL